MAVKNISSELDGVFKAFQVFTAAKQVLSEESTEITNATRTSITNSISASTASGEKKQELFSDALVYAMKAGEILLRLQKRLKEDYGRFWRQDLITSSLFAIPEQEIVEATSPGKFDRPIIETPFLEITSLGNDPSTLPPVFTAISTTTLPGCIALIISDVKISGAGRPKTCAVVMTTFDLEHIFFIPSC